MTSCADQWADCAPIEGNAQARTRKYSITGQITADCHKQSQFPAHNSIVILQTTPERYQDQQKRNMGNNSSVILQSTEALYRVCRKCDMPSGAYGHMTPGAYVYMRVCAYNNMMI